MKQEKPTPSDVLAVMFYLGKREFYRNDPGALQAALLELRERSPLLRETMFSLRRPFTREFDLAMSELKRSCVLRAIYTAGQSVIVLDREARRYVEAAILPRFTPSELLDLKAVAEVFGETVANRER